MPTSHTARVNFVLPHETNLPIGGYKVVYEYANRLVERGYSVGVILPKQMAARTGALGELKNAIWPRMHRLRNPGGITWFPLDPRVNVVFCSDLREKWLPAADYVFATSWRTAPFVAGYSQGQGRKMYLIQHLETFGGSDEEVIGTWKLPLHKIVISKWLGEFAASLGERFSYIPNGINFSEFGVDTPIDGRKPRLAMLYHNDAIKGSWDGINAMELVRESFPNFTAVLFGVPGRPGSLPRWIDYVRNASNAQLRKIYNDASIFVHPSWSEGWPLPPAEAMACGAAVVAEANPGVMDYLKSGETCLASRIKYWQELAENIVTLLEDEPRRAKIARAGNEDIQQYTWEKAVDRFELALREAG